MNRPSVNRWVRIAALVGAVAVFVFCAVVWLVSQ